MPRYCVTEISEIVHATIKGNNNLYVKHLQYDSRNIIASDETMFLAIAGERHDGHKYIRTMYDCGVRSFLISDPSCVVEDLHNAAFLCVNNVVEALQKLVAHHRSQFHVPVLAITGSNGKTIVKEWLTSALLTKEYVVRSPKSYNSQIGVPLSVWQMNLDSTWGVFEAGVSEVGEMQRLADVIQATEGVFTCIGEAHQQGFSSIAEKISEKLNLFESCERIFYCRDHQLIHEAIETRFGSTKELVTWSVLDDNARLKATILTQKEKITRLSIAANGCSFQLDVQFADRASIENILQVVNYLCYHNYSATEIKQTLGLLHPIAMRLEQLKGLNGSTIINDAYNSDINSLSIALDYLRQISDGNRTIVLSDIPQSGMSNAELYGRVAGMLNKAEVGKLVGVGPAISSCQSAFSEFNAEFYPTTKAFIETFTWKSWANSYILLKGAREYKFEDVVAVLSEKNHTTVLESNLNHLINNLNYYRTKLSTGTQVMAMVKALAYGSGNVELAAQLQHEKVDYLGVAFVDEGVQLRKYGITLPIMVMAPSAEDFTRIIEYNLEPEIYSLSILERFLEQAVSQQLTNYAIHIKIDTGMHRLGFEAQDVTALLKVLKKSNAVKVKSVFSHLAASDEYMHDAFTEEQINTFVALSNAIEKDLAYSFMRHIVNSAGIERFPNAHFDMVRLGIGLHGISAEGQELEPVSTLKTHIVQIKSIAKGQTVGYSRRGVAHDKMRIAIIPVGYADGLDRKLGNGNAYVSINGKKAYYVGSICMDLSMVDISDVACKEGDEVVVFGKDPSIKYLAEKINTIPYEVLTNVSSRVKRVYIKD